MKREYMESLHESGFRHRGKNVPLDRLALPGSDPVRVDLVIRGDLLQRPVAPKRGQGGQAAISEQGPAAKR